MNNLETTFVHPRPCVELTRMDGDTELLLVLLESSLPNGFTLRKEELLEALINADGNVEKATESIRGSSSSSRPTIPGSMSPGPRGTKRKALGLQGWVKTSKPRNSDSTDDSETRAGPSRPRTPPILYSASKESTQSPPPLLNFLKDTTPKSSALPRRPPLMLGTPELVSQHTPTTIFPSVLPAGQHY